MATITLNYNPNDSLAKKTLDYILSLGVFSITETKKKSEFEQALQEVKEGKVNEYDNVEDLLHKIMD